MASGKPVISTMSGSIPEVVGDAGILIPSGDYMSLANSILELIENKKLREDSGKAGRERAEQLFSASKKCTYQRCMENISANEVFDAAYSYLKWEVNNASC